MSLKTERIQSWALVLKGDGKDSFKAMTIAQSGIYIPDSGRDIAKLKMGNSDYMLVASQNKGRLKAFQLNQR